MFSTLCPDASYGNDHDHIPHDAHVHVQYSFQEHCSLPVMPDCRDPHMPDPELPDQKKLTSQCSEESEYHSLDVIVTLVLSSFI